MNLNELKQLWEEDLAEAPKVQVPAEEMRRWLRQQGQQALSRIHRHILLEAGITAILVLGAGLWLQRQEPVAAWWEWTGLLTFLLAASLFLWIKYRALNLNPLMQRNLKSALTLLEQRMGLYLNLYRSVLLVFVPVLGCGGILYGLYRSGLHTGIDLRTQLQQHFSLILAVMVGYSLLAMVFFRWFYQRLYGKPYAAVQACLAELAEQPADSIAHSE